MSFYIQDPMVTLLGYLSIDLFCLGYFDQARLECEAAVEEARKLGHAFSLAHALSGACQVDWATRSREELLARADALIAVSDEHGFPFYRAVGTVYRGWALAGSGQTAAGNCAARGWRGRIPRDRGGGGCALLSHIARRRRGQGERAGRGAGPSRRGRAADGRDEDRWAEAELHRVRGELLRAGHDPAGAERCFCRAIDIAQQQSAKFWELRAAISLARLWREQGKRDAARDLLAPIYGWFTEGFDTPVLKEAKALLDTLAP